MVLHGTQIFLKAKQNLILAMAKEVMEPAFQKPFNYNNNTSV